MNFPKFETLITIRTGDWNIGKTRQSEAISWSKLALSCATGRDAVYLLPVQTLLLVLPPFVSGDIGVTKLTNIHPVFNYPRYWIQVFLNAITSLAIISDMTGWCDCSEVDSLNWICKFWGHFLYKGFPKTDFTGYLKVNLIFLKKDKKSTFFVFRLCDPLDPLTVLHLQTFSLV